MSRLAEDHLYGLDLVKVVAIIWICLYHLLDFHRSWEIGTLFGSGRYWEYFASSGNIFSTLVMVLISLGVVGVNLFIIASGVGLTVSSNRKRIGYLSFFKKRVVKIFPYYWFVLVGILLFELLFGHQVNYFDYFVHFLGINNFFPEYVLTISAPFWFIGTIFQLYLLFPFVFQLSKKIHPILLLSLAVLLKVYVDPFLVDFFAGGRFFTEYIVDFVFGIVIGNIIVKRSLSYSPIKMVSLFCVFILSLFSIIFVNLYADYHLFLPLIYQISAVSLFVILFVSSKFIHIKLLSILAYLSSLSFIVFLTHYYFLTNFFARIPFKIPFLFETLIFLVLSFIIASFVNRLSNLALMPNGTNNS